MKQTPVHDMWAGVLCTLPCPHMQIHIKYSTNYIIYWPINDINQQIKTSHTTTKLGIT